jgi:pectinesterase
MRQVTVDARGREDFRSIREAVTAIRRDSLKSADIVLKNGVYTEKLDFPGDVVIHLTGESPEDTIIQYDDYALKSRPDGNPYGTFRTPTVTIRASRTHLASLTIANTAGSGPSVGQAVALAALGDEITCDRIRLVGHQDTLFTGGAGPQQFHHCYIAGTVDFIFGPSMAIFDHCQIHSIGRGYVTAASTPVSQAVGYLFYDCCLTSAGIPPASVYLGRPWRPYASVTFVHTKMGDHIHPQGWNNWRDPNNETTARYAEYGSYGPGAAAAARAPWATVGTLSDLPWDGPLGPLLSRWSGWI